MLIRTFEGKTVPEALASVKRELGADACVLEVRRQRGGVEVLAVAERPGCDPAALAAPAPATLRTDAEWLRDHLDMLGFSPVFAERIAASAQENLDVERLADSGFALDYARSLVRSLVPTAPALIGGRGRLVALVGPNGVGKTTTLLKIAARERIANGKQVVLASADDRRLGGAAQVEGFARMIDASFVEVNERRDLDRLRAEVGERGIVLLDTPGVPQGDARGMDRLEAILAGSERSEIELVLAADKDVETLSSTVKRFRSLSPGCAGATRLDEAARPGCLTSALARSRLPLRHIGCGPNVPDDLKLAGDDQFAEWAVPVNALSAGPFAGAGCYR